MRPSASTVSLAVEQGLGADRFQARTAAGRSRPATARGRSTGRAAGTGRSRRGRSPPPGRSRAPCGAAECRNGDRHGLQDALVDVDGDVGARRGGAAAKAEAEQAGTRRRGAGRAGIEGLIGSSRSSSELKLTVICLTVERGGSDRRTARPGAARPHCAGSDAASTAGSACRRGRRGRPMSRPRGAVSLKVTLMVTIGRPAPSQFGVPQALQFAVQRGRARRWRRRSLARTPRGLHRLVSAGVGPRAAGDWRAPACGAWCESGSAASASSRVGPAAAWPSAGRGVGLGGVGAASASGWARAGVGGGAAWRRWRRRGAGSGAAALRRGLRDRRLGRAAGAGAGACTAGAAAAPRPAHQCHRHHVADMHRRRPRPAIRARREDGRVQRRRRRPWPGSGRRAAAT